MKTKFIITALVLILAMPAVAQFRAIEDGYEVALSNVRLPRYEGGTIAYKPCSDCDYRTSRVNADARWVINGRALELGEFRKRTALINDRDNHTVNITRHIESNRITAISILVRESE